MSKRCALCDRPFPGGRRNYCTIVCTHRAKNLRKQGREPRDPGYVGLIASPKQLYESVIVVRNEARQYKQWDLAHALDDAAEALWRATQIG